MFTILHLSDLHRSPDEPLDNTTLIAALLADRDRYVGETPAVPEPDAIVVSGDLIQGARIGEANWANVVREQYEAAGEFLEALAQRFLNGDKSRLVMIPGNHDVCWNHSIAAMDKLEPSDYPSDVYRAITQPDTSYRWSWPDRALYRINDQQQYALRLSAYWDFAERFYEGVALPLPIDRKRPFQMFELDQRRIAVAAFDSTFGNDCFGYSGALTRGAVGACDLHLRDVAHSYAMRMAVWHHSLQGPPARDDYMDVTQIHEMAGLKFQLGLHGHQHIAQAATHYVYLGQSQAMAVVSAGSLCAGSHELPRGTNRQYNVIAINDDYLGARVHVREMAEGSQFARKLSGAFSQGYVEVEWQAITDLQGRAVNSSQSNDKRSTIAAEDALQSGDPAQALRLLDGVDLNNAPHARAVAIQAALKIPDWPRLVALIGDPKTTEERILLTTAFTKLGDTERAEQILAGSTDIDNRIRIDLEGQIATKKALRGK